MSKSLAKSVRAALDGLVVACYDEGIALDAAALIVRGPERKGRLQQQSRRRAVFRRDLEAGVVALGGVPTKGASYGARVRSAFSSVRGLLAGPHQGDAYATCARATGKSALAYSKALDLELAGDVRFGLDRQYVEVEFDRQELRRLRWGGSLMPVSRQDTDMDERALETWSEDGGRGDNLEAELLRENSLHIAVAR